MKSLSVMRKVFWILLMMISASASHASAATFWHEDWVGTAGQEPTGWQDERQSSYYSPPGWTQGSTGGRLYYSGNSSAYLITQPGSSGYGEVYFWLTVTAIEANHFLQFQVKMVTPTASSFWQVAIIELVNGSMAGTFWDDNNGNYSQTVGNLVYDFSSVFPTTGSQFLGISLMVDGAYAGDMVEFGQVKITDSATWEDDVSTPTATDTIVVIPTATATSTATPSITLTSTSTPTVTPTFTATPTPTPARIFRQRLSYDNKARKMRKP